MSKSDSPVREIKLVVDNHASPPSLAQSLRRLATMIEDGIINQFTVIALRDDCGMLVGAATFG